MKTIHNFRDKEYVRILDSTYYPSEEKKAMIGTIGEVRARDYDRDTLGVYTSDKSNHWDFNKSDTQIVFPDFVIDGHILGVGDKIESKYGNIHTVFDITWYDNGLNIKTYRDKDYTCNFTISNIKGFTLHSTVYPRKDEEVAKAIKLLEDKGIIKAGKIIS